MLRAERSAAIYGVRFSLDGDSLQVDARPVVQSITPFCDTSGTPAHLLHEQYLDLGVTGSGAIAAFDDGYALFFLPGQSGPRDPGGVVRAPFQVDEDAIRVGIRPNTASLSHCGDTWNHRQFAMLPSATLYEYIQELHESYGPYTFVGSELNSQGSLWLAYQFREAERFVFLAIDSHTGELQERHITPRLSGVLFPQRLFNANPQRWPIPSQAYASIGRLPQPGRALLAWFEGDDEAGLLSWNGLESSEDLIKKIDLGIPVSVSRRAQTSVLFEDGEYLWLRDAGGEIHVSEVATGQHRRVTTGMDNIVHTLGTSSATETIILAQKRSGLKWFSTPRTSKLFVGGSTRHRVDSTVFTTASTSQPVTRPVSLVSSNVVSQPWVELARVTEFRLGRGDGQRTEMMGSFLLNTDLSQAPRWQDPQPLLIVGMELARERRGGSSLLHYGLHNAKGEPLGNMVTFHGHGGDAGLIGFRTDQDGWFLLQTRTAIPTGRPEIPATGAAFYDHTTGTLHYAKDFLGREAVGEFAATLCDVGDFTQDGRLDFVFYHTDHANPQHASEAQLSLVQLQQTADGKTFPRELARSRVMGGCNMLDELANNVTDDRHAPAWAITQAIHKQHGSGKWTTTSQGGFSFRGGLVEYDIGHQLLYMLQREDAPGSDRNEQSATWQQWQQERITRWEAWLNEHMLWSMPAFLPYDRHIAGRQIEQFGRNGYSPGAPNFYSVALLSEAFPEMESTIVPSVPFDHFGFDIGGRDRALLERLTSTHRGMDFPCSAGPVGDVFLCDATAARAREPSPTRRGELALPGVGRLLWGFDVRSGIVLQPFEHDGMEYTLAFARNRVAIFAGGAPRLEVSAQNWPGRDDLLTRDLSGLRYLGSQDLALNLLNMDAPELSYDQQLGRLEHARLRLFGHWLLVADGEGAGELYRVHLRQTTASDQQRRAF